MLRPAEAAKLKADAESALTSSCTIIYRSYVPDGAGGQTLMENRIEDVACRYCPVGSPKELLAQGAVAGRQVATLLLSLDTTISREDSIEISGEVYEIIGLHKSSESSLQRLTCQLVT